MQMIEISSGKGPTECEMAVGRYMDIFLREHSNATIKEKQNGSIASSGRLAKECYKGALLEVPEGEAVELGTVKWI